MVDEGEGPMNGGDKKQKRTHEQRKNVIKYVCMRDRVTLETLKVNKSNEVNAIECGERKTEARRHEIILIYGTYQ